MVELQVPDYRPGPLQGVVFSTRRKTEGQAGRDTTRFCQAIIEHEGSIQKALGPTIDFANGNSPEARQQRISCHLSILWTNPRQLIGDLYPSLSERI